VNGQALKNYFLVTGNNALVNGQLLENNALVKWP